MSRALLRRNALPAGDPKPDHCPQSTPPSAEGSTRAHLTTIQFIQSRCRMSRAPGPIEGQDGWMRYSAEESRSLALAQRVGRLATVSEAGGPHLVPVTFAVSGGLVVIGIDEKPKSTLDLKRLRNIRSDPRVALCWDRYDEDWSLTVVGPGRWGRRRRRGRSRLGNEHGRRSTTSTSSTVTPHIPGRSSWSR